MSNSERDWIIRPATTADAETIAEFNTALAAETEDHPLEPEVIRAGVEQLLADPRLGRYLMADRDGEPIGQVMHTYEWSDWRNGMIWWIQSVYVAPAARRRGVLRSLLEHLEDEARRDPGVRGLRLYVERDNRPALDTYHDLGFTGEDYLVREKLFDDE